MMLYWLKCLHSYFVSITFDLVDDSGGNAAATSNVTVLLIADVATGTTMVLHSIVTTPNLDAFQIVS